MMRMEIINIFAMFVTILPSSHGQNHLLLSELLWLQLFLFDLFFSIGSSPTILQSDNGKEFCANVIKELVDLWPSIKIINGRPRHPQSQGLVERANGIIQQKLGKWRETSGRNDWSYEFHLVV